METVLFLLAYIVLGILPVAYLLNCALIYWCVHLDEKQVRESGQFTPDVAHRLEFFAEMQIKMHQNKVLYKVVRNVVCMAVLAIVQFNYLT